MSDKFDAVYKLKRAGKNKVALSLLVDQKTGRIKKPYNDDLNHAWYTVGDIYYKGKEYYKAINAFKKAFMNWSDDVESLWAIANCYSEIGKSWLTKYYLEKAIQLSGEKDGLRYNLGNALFDMGKYREAIKQYKKVRSKDKQLYKLACSNIKKAEKLVKMSSTSM